jgi:hypothetical protein
MSDQQSQKRGLRSEAQKEERARAAYEPVPPSNPVSGAFGERKGNLQTNEKTAPSNKKARKG